jgi:hypothetical protein
MTKKTTFPDWIKALPDYKETPGIFSNSLYPGTIGCTVELPGGKWSSDSHDEDEKLSHHPAKDRLLFVWSASNYFCWEAVLIIEEDEFYCRVYGSSATITEAAEAALAYEFETAMVDGLTWYANKNGPNIEWEAKNENGEILTVMQNSNGGYEWKVCIPEIELFKAAGMTFDGLSRGDYQSGFAVSLVDAASAIKNAPAVLEAACRSYLTRNK